MLHCFREVFGFCAAKYSDDYLVWLSLRINILCFGQHRDFSMPSYWPRGLTPTFCIRKKEASRVKNFLLGKHTQLVSEMKRFPTLDG